MRDDEAAREATVTPPTRPGTAFSGPGVELRRARSGDAAALAGLERAVFPTLWPRTNFRREIARPGHLVLLTAPAPAGVPTAPMVEREEPAAALPAVPAPGAGPFTRALGSLRALVTPAPDQHNDAAGTLAGYVTVWFVVDEAHVAAIGVRPEARGRGVGELLLLGAIEAAAEHGCTTVTLEVRSSNQTARALYTKYGFRDVGLRKRYYVDNGEDAVIMTTPRITDPDYAEKLAGLSRDHSARWAQGRRVGTPTPRWR